MRYETGDNCGKIVAGEFTENFPAERGGVAMHYNIVHLPTGTVARRTRRATMWTLGVVEVMTPHVVALGQGWGYDEVEIRVVTRQMLRDDWTRRRLERRRRAAWVRSLRK